MGLLEYVRVLLTTPSNIHEAKFSKYSSDVRCVSAIKMH